MVARGGLGTLFTLTLLGNGAACVAGCSDSATPDSSEVRPQPIGEHEAPVAARAISSKLLSAAVPARLDQGIELANAGLASRVTLKYAGARDVPAERGPASVRYRNALGPGFDVTLEMRGGALEDTVELPSAPAGDVIRYELTRDENVAGFRAVHGQIEMLDASGTPALRVGRAKVIDARGAEHPIALTMSDCELEHDGVPPWGRPVTAPGAERCTIEARLPKGLAYPARLDPTWDVTGSMNEFRYDVPVVLLPNGRAFVVGGRGEGAEVNAEVYDPQTETWTYVPSADLTLQAYDFTLTAIPDGRVLLTGGEWDLPSGTIVATAQALDTTTFVWAPLPAMAQARSLHAATVLSDGRVLVSGGRPPSDTPLSSCEIFSPTTNTWAPTGPLIVGRYLHEAIEHGGRVLVAGGLPPGESSTETSEIFEPGANGGVGAWGTPRVFANSRYGHAMALLGSSRAIILGGTFNDQLITPMKSVQIYDFDTNLWTPGPDLPVPAGIDGLMFGRAGQALDGGVIFTGGCEDYYYCDGPSNLATYFDPVTGAATPAGTIGDPRGRHGLVALQDGSLLLMGGRGSGSYFNSALILKGLQNGELCDKEFQCASDLCVDGVCCESACDGTCESCLGAATGGADGVCALITTDTDPDGDCADDGAPNCGQNGLCDGGGECATYDGPGCTPRGCSDGAECDSGYCVDGICCDTACEASCYACTAAKKGTGGDGTCGPISVGLDPDEDCANGAAGDCDALRLCDGFGACESAAALCAPFACGDAGCLETCSSLADCVSGFVCIGEACIDEDALCSNESILLQADGSTLDCAPYRCTPTECKTSCASLDDCSTPYVCDGETSTCILPPAGTGGDAGCSTGRASRSRGWLLLALAWVALRRRR